MKLNKVKSGFSLIEVIIAFSILTITILGATNLISNSIQNNQENILRVQAYFLAQEGLELTRAYRDTQWLEGKTDFNLPSSGTYQIEFPETNQPITLTSLQPELYLNSKYKFTHTATDTTPSQFKRNITIKKIDDLDNLSGFSIKKGSGYSSIKNEETTFGLENQSRQVTSSVNYMFNNVEKTIELTTILSNWKQI